MQTSNIQTGHPIRLNIPITKIDEEQRTVWGYATVEEIDVHGEIISYPASQKAFSNWIGNIREMHSNVAVGKGVEVKFDDVKKGIWLGAKISESTDGQNAWIKVKEGVLAGFSIGGSIKDFEMRKVGDEDHLVVTEYDLFEVSLVDNPACPSATLQVVKSAAGKLQRVEKMGQGIGRPVAWWERMYKFSDSQKVMKPGFLIYNKNSMVKTASKVTKNIYDASSLVELGLCLRWYLAEESWEGNSHPDLEEALETIKGAAATELDEKEKYPKPVDDAINMAAGVLEIKTEADLAKKVKRISEFQKNVFGEETRDADGNVVATPAENAVGANNNPESAVAEPEEAAKEEVEEPNEEKEPAKKAEKPKAKAEPEKKPAAEDEPEDEPEPEEPAEPQEPKKAAAGGDLKQATKPTDLAKTITDAVEAAVQPLKDRLKAIEGQPADSKAVKGGFVEVEKNSKPEGEGDKNRERFDELMKRADELGKNPNLGTQEERVGIGIELRKLSRLMDPRSVAQHAAIRASLPSSK